VPFIIVILMALPATAVVVAMKDTSAADLTIKATGIQWKWGYDYLERRRAPASASCRRSTSPSARQSDRGKPEGDDYLLSVDNPLVVRSTRRSASSRPRRRHPRLGRASLGVKQDAIPGFVRDTWFRADQDRRLLRPVLRALRQGARVHADPRQGRLAAGLHRVGEREGQGGGGARRRSSKVWELAPLVARGEQVYTANCQVCHQANGKGGGNVKALDASPTVLDADKTKQIHVVLNGQNNGAMPAWKQLSDTEIAAVVTFTKNHWSNAPARSCSRAKVAAARK
jgi:cytochrome c oxidase subunit 2